MDILKAAKIDPTSPPESEKPPPSATSPPEPAVSSSPSDPRLQHPLHPHLAAFIGDTSDWIIHVKELHVRIDFDRLLSLPVDKDRYAERFAYAVGWALDPDRYAAVKRAFPNKNWRNCPYTTLSSSDIKIMLERGVVHVIDPEQVEGHVILFRVPEPAKKRWRPIRFTKDINEILDHDTIMPVDMATKKNIVSLLHKGSHAVAFDAKAFFDQFKLDPSISRLMCFKKGRRFYALSTSPMGQRHSVELAHTAMEKLVHHPELECATAVIIDNAIFVGSFDQCLRDAYAFLSRCAAVGCTINEDTSDVPSLISTKQDWGGVSLDFANKTTCLTTKFVEKVKLSWSLRDRWSRESFASHMGLLFWAIGLIECYPGDYFPALQSYAALSRRAAYLTRAPAAEQNAFWSASVHFEPTALAALDEWTQAVVRNCPRVAHEPRSGMPDWLVSVDACKSGFGYVALNPVTGESKYHGQRWPASFVAMHRAKLHRSVFTEPNGVIMSMCHLLEFTNVRQTVHIWTDSVTTKSTGNKGFTTRSEDVNDCVRRLRQLFPTEHFSFSFSHIAGIDNEAADAASRQQVVSQQALEKAHEYMIGDLMLSDSPSGGHC